MYVCTPTPPPLACFHAVLARGIPVLQVLGNTKPAPYGTGHKVLFISCQGGGGGGRFCCPMYWTQAASLGITCLSHATCRRKLLLLCCFWRVCVRPPWSNQSIVYLPTYYALTKTLEGKKRSRGVEDVPLGIHVTNYTILRCSHDRHLCIGCR